jgi:hypothetical protein
MQPGTYSVDRFVAVSNSGYSGLFEDLEQRCGRRLKPFPVGRPQKADVEMQDQMALG